MIFIGEYKSYNSSGVYKIVNTQNGKFYIGSAQCFRTRFNSHVSKFNTGLHHNKHLYSSYNKYGTDSFEFHILELCEKTDLYSREQYYLDLLKPEYNSQEKAGIWRGNNSTSRKGGFKKGYKQSFETIQKRLESLKKRRASGIVDKRAPHSKESYQKTAEKLKGRPRPIEVIEKMKKTKRENRENKSLVSFN